MYPSGDASSARSTAASSSEDPPTLRKEAPAVVVTQARLLEGATPIVGSEVPVYIILKEVETGRLFEAPLEHPGVFYRWSVGPEKRYCVYHQDIPAKIGDIRNGREYCCVECFRAGRRNFNPGPPLTMQTLRHIVDTEVRYAPVANTKFFTPNMSDVDRPLRLEVCGSAGDVFTLVTELVIPPPQGPMTYRRWVSPMGYGAPPGYQPFRVFSWNILAQLYCNEDTYPAVQPHVLSWSYRKHLIVREILGYRSDIVCLQEVEKAHWEDTILPALEHAGYSGVYLEKTNVMFTNKYTVEGCAILYRQQRFALVEQMSIEFNNLAHTFFRSKRTRSKLDQRALNRLLKGNVALCLIFEDLLHGGQVCVANTHIIASPEHCDVKLWQANMLLQTLDEFLSTKNEVVGTVICGDFNSPPDSSVYGLYSEGTVDPDHPEMSDPHGLLKETDFCQHHQLASSYYATMGHEAPLTNWMNEQETLTLDYIFYDTRVIRPTATLEVANTGYLPSAQHPSDHLPIASDFVFNDWA
jgi:mRNA deadenylase 3'-5' endonuclease subunit Ccr4